MARHISHSGRPASLPTEDTATRREAATRSRRWKLAAALAVLVLIVASTAAGAATKVYSIVYGDTLNSIAAEHGTDVATLVGLNEVDDPDMIIAGADLNVPDGDLTTYTIREGDTLAGIAAAHGVSMRELAVVNKIADVDLITVGEVLMIYLPVDDATATSEAAEPSETSEDGAADPAGEADDTATDETDDAEAAEETDETDATDDTEADDMGDENEGTSDESQSGRLHLVREGETLADVAAAYDVTVEQLIAANALEAAEISAGMILKIPLARSEGVELIGMPTGQEQWPLMSELAAASIATAYWGAPVTAEALLASLERSENPHLGFRGDPHGMFGTTEDYGVYHTPLAEALTAHGFTAEAFYADGDRTTLTSRIDAGVPVVVWVTHNLELQERIVVENDLGRFSLIPEQHAVVVYGYDAAGVRVMDVGTGASAVWGWDEFMASWALFDGMALAVDLQ